MSRLSAGIVITTTAQREGQAVPVTAVTSPCVVERLEAHSSPADSSHAEAAEGTLRFVLEEGRNRQIRRMCAALGLEVTRLHRVSFAGVSLSRVEKEGSWAELTEEELYAIGALKPPTREERRTPEERAARRAKKEAKRRPYGAPLGQSRDEGGEEEAKEETKWQAKAQIEELGAQSARAFAPADQKLSCKGAAAARARRRASRSSLF